MTHRVPNTEKMKHLLTFRILRTPPGVGGGGLEIIGIWVKCFNFFWYLVPYDPQPLGLTPDGDLLL